MDIGTGIAIGGFALASGGYAIRLMTMKSRTNSNLEKLKDKVVFQDVCKAQHLNVETKIVDLKDNMVSIKADLKESMVDIKSDLSEVKSNVIDLLKIIKMPNRFT